MRIYEDLRAVQTRLTLLQYVVVGLLSLMLAVFWHLQVLRGRQFRERAENNGSRKVAIAAPRGLLMDRHGKVLVENRPSFNLVMSPGHTTDADRCVATLSRLLGLGEGAIRERLLRRTPHKDVIIKADAGIGDVAAVEARRFELPQTTVEVVPLRSYPLGSAAAHVLGYVGEITERQLESRAYRAAGFTAGDVVGRDGIEERYNARLKGAGGQREVTVNSRGVEVDEQIERPPVIGQTVTLSLDAGLQATMEQAFAGRTGAAVALDPRNGEILAMTSLPSFDSNHFSTGIDAAHWGGLLADSAKPLMNRVIQGRYAPGSVFKILTTIAALEEGVITPETRFYCPGYFSKYGKDFHCLRAGGHGTLDLTQALAHSCNVYFFNVGVRLEIDRIADWANRRLHLTEKTGVDLPGEVEGLVGSPEWKQKRFGTTWFAGETVSVAIGQGQVEVTPIQLARLAAAAATGKLVSPHLVIRIGDEPCAVVPYGTEPPAKAPCAVVAPRDLGLRPATLAALHRGLRAVVAPGGSGARASLPGITVAGKTGSAQVVQRSRLAKDQAFENQPHGWFVGWAPAEDPQIAFAVLVEHGASGGGSAAPIAREILAHFFGLSAPSTTPMLLASPVG